MLKLTDKNKLMKPVLIYYYPIITYTYDTQAMYHVHPDKMNESHIYISKFSVVLVQQNTFLLKRLLLIYRFI